MGGGAAAAARGAAGRPGGAAGTGVSPAGGGPSAIESPVAQAAGPGPPPHARAGLAPGLGPGAGVYRADGAFLPAPAVPQLLYGGKLDFLVFDYLSEITMSLLTAAKARSPVSRAGVRPQRAGLGRGGCAPVLCDLPSSPSAQIAPETCLRHTWSRGHGFLSILFIRMYLFVSVQCHLVKVFVSFPVVTQMMVLFER